MEPGTYFDSTAFNLPIILILDFIQDLLSSWKYGVRFDQQTRGPGRRSRKIAKDQERQTGQTVQRPETTT